MAKRIVYIKVEEVTESFSKYWLVDKFGRKIGHDYFESAEGPRDLAHKKGYELKGRI